MNIRKNSWHLNVFLKTHVYDRNWIEIFCPGYNHRLTTELPEITAYNKAFEEYCNKKEKERTDEDRENIRQLESAAYRAKQEWHKQDYINYCQKQSQDNLDKLNNGLMSLCPYFWSVVASLLIYYPVVIPLRKINSFLGRLLSPIEKIFINFEENFLKITKIIAITSLVLAALGIFSLIGHGIYHSRDKIPQVPSIIISSVKNEYEQWQINREWHKKEAVRKAEWEKEHPEEVKRQKEYESSSRSAKWRRAWNDFKDLFLGLVFLAGATIASILFILFVVGMVRFVQFIGVSIKNRSTWQNLCLFWNDTRELIYAFLKAKKEKVCPFLHITNGEDEN